MRGGKPATEKPQNKLATSVNELIMQCGEATCQLSENATEGAMRGQGRRERLNREQ